MPSYEPDFRLDGYEAVNDHVADQFWGHIGIEQDQMTVLAEHHSDDAEHSFYLLCTNDTVSADQLYVAGVVTGRWSARMTAAPATDQPSLMVNTWPG
jgi:hypothetical protein